MQYPHLDTPVSPLRQRVRSPAPKRSFHPGQALGSPTNLSQREFVITGSLVPILSRQCKHERKQDFGPRST
jgi:hypothetical protein